MDEWEKFNKSSLPEKKKNYTNINMEHIACMQKVFVNTLK